MFQDHMQHFPPSDAFRHGQQTLYDGLHSITDPAPVLLSNHVAGEQHPVEERTPHIYHTAADPGGGHVLWQLLFEHDIEAGHNLCADPCALAADIAVLV